MLASGSTARRDMLRSAGVTFEVVASDIDEAAVKQSMRDGSGSSHDLAIRLAAMKAMQVSAVRPEAIVIGADQILDCDGVRFDKPASLAEAATHLRRLRGLTHRLVTAAACVRSGRLLWHDVSAPVMSMRLISDRFIESYIAAEGDELLNCVGGYRVESRGAQLFDAVEGNYFSILGLPLIPLLGFLRQIDALES